MAVKEEPIQQTLAREAAQRVSAQAAVMGVTLLDPAVPTFAKIDCITRLKQFIEFVESLAPPAGVKEE